MCWFLIDALITMSARGRLPRKTHTHTHTVTGRHTQILKGGERGREGTPVQAGASWLPCSRPFSTAVLF